MTGKRNARHTVGVGFPLPDRFGAACHYVYGCIVRNRDLLLRLALVSGSWLGLVLSGYPPAG